MTPKNVNSLDKMKANENRKENRETQSGPSRNKNVRWLFLLKALVTTALPGGYRLPEGEKGSGDPEKK